MILKMRRLIVLAVLFTGCSLLAFPQNDRQLQRQEDNKSKKRTALVIGNSDYQIARKLANPVNDATDMAAALQELKFEVISGTNLSLRQMNEKIREFGDKLKTNGGIGLFYYAGHGIQVGGHNYLIPVEADIPREDEVDFNALNVDLVLRKMATANNGLNIVILDACRNNPFSRSWNRGDDAGGLAQMSAPIGTFIAYATSPEKTANDGEGRNGLYTSQMLRFLKVPNLKIEETFKEVRKAVDAASGGKQVPWDSSSLRGEFYFITDSNLVAEKTQITLNKYQLPTIGQAERRVTISAITGGFDGDISNTELTINGQPVTKLSESRETLIFVSPLNVVGLAEIRLKEGGVETKGIFRNLLINLSAPKTDLKTGEEVILTIKIEGLKKLEKSLPLSLRLEYEGAASPRGGNLVEILVSPEEVKDGAITKFVTLDAVKSGKFRMWVNIEASSLKGPM